MSPDTRIPDRRTFLKLTGLTGFAWLTTGVSLLEGCATSLEPDPALEPPGPAPLDGYSALSPTSPASSQRYTSLDPTNQANFSRPLLLPGQSGPFGVIRPTAPLPLTATTTELSLVEGHPSSLLVYQSTVGSSSYVNPLLYVRQGETLNIKLVNDLDEDTIVHWHGLFLDWKQDGHPSYVIPPGQSYDYSFAIPNRSGTYWYHPHPDMMTAEQAYRGLAGLLIVEDDDELRLRTALNLTFGVTDIPLVLQDKRFNNDSQMIYAPDLQETFDGYLGDVAFVNFTVNPVLEVSSRLYRFRLLNGSNARLFRLAFMKGKSQLTFSIIGTDGGLLEKAYQTSETFLSPGERVDILLDLSNTRPGDQVWLQTLPFDAMNSMSMGAISAGAMGDMGGAGAISAGAMSATTDASRDVGETGGRGGRGSRSGQADMGDMGGAGALTSTLHLEQGQAFNLLKLSVTQRVNQPVNIPASLSTLSRIDTTGAAVRKVTVASPSVGSRQFTINGETFQMDACPITVKRNTIEIWEMTNVGASPGVSAMPHPMHVHGACFRVLSRSGSPAQLGKPVDGSGRIITDLGWKDTCLIWPGETVRLAMDFTNNYPGEQILMLHCHILEHEDRGMMINYKVV